MAEENAIKINSKLLLQRLNALQKHLTVRPCTARAGSLADAALTPCGTLLHSQPLHIAGECTTVW